MLITRPLKDEKYVEGTVLLLLLHIIYRSHILDSYSTTLVCQL